MQILSAIRNSNPQNSKINLKQAPTQDSNDWARRVKRFADNIKYRYSSERETFVQAHRHEILAWAATKERLVAQPAHRVSEICKTRDWRLIAIFLLLLAMFVLLIIDVVILKMRGTSASMEFFCTLCVISPVFVFVAYYMMIFAECMDTSYSFWCAACRQVGSTEFNAHLSMETMDKISDAYRNMKHIIDDSMESIVDFWWDISDSQDKNNEWTTELLEILSLGKMREQKIDSLKKVQSEMKHRSNGDEISREYIRQFDEAGRTIRDLCCLWKSELNGFKLCDPNMLKSDKMTEMAEKIGVDILVDAYVAGVPVEDIIA